MKSDMSAVIEAINGAARLVVIQAENPDGDSLSSALALEDLLANQGKQVSLYCSVEMPKYLRYLPGWDRVQSDLENDFDLAIIVDASTLPLLERVFTPANNHKFAQAKTVIIDHHDTPVDLPIPTINLLNSKAISTGEVIYDLAAAAKWEISQTAANMIASSIMSDSLGLTSAKTSAKSVRILSQMMEKGADLALLEEARREHGKKSHEIFQYKGRLFERVELHLDGRLALVVIPWEEIEAYSDQYNPSMLIIDEMRMIEDVQVAAAFKLYPDGKITAKLRANSGAQFMNKLAEHFGGGGHAFAAGFKLNDMPYEALKKEFINTAQRMLEEQA